MPTRAVRIVASLLVSLLLVSCAGCLVLPAPTRELSVYGIKGQVVDASTGQPIRNAVIATESLVHSERSGMCRSNSRGKFVLKSAHVGKADVLVIAPMTVLIIPGENEYTEPVSRDIVVRVPGYLPAQFTVWIRPSGVSATADHPGRANAEVKGDYLFVGMLPLTRYELRHQRAPAYNLDAKGDPDQF